MKRKILVVLIALMVCVLTGCYVMEDDVPLATLSEIVKYSNNKFGKAEVIGSESNDGDNGARGRSITYKLKDEQYGFEYIVKSYSWNNNIDGTNMGWFEAKSDTFSEQYLLEFRKCRADELANFEEKYDMIIDYHSFGNLLSLNSRSVSGVKAVNNEAIKAFQSLLKQFDTRKYWKQSRIALNDKDGVYLGYCLAWDSKFISSKDEQIDLLMLEAQNDFHDVGKVSFTMHETVEIASLPELVGYAKNFGYNLDNVKNNRTEVTLYYFTCNGKTYYITDIEYSFNKHIKSYKVDEFENVILE